MASLQKRGRYYYGRWRKTVDGERIEIKKSLGLTYKDKAQKALSTLDRMHQAGEIDPFSPAFEPKKILNKTAGADKLNIKTMRAAADYFYKKKSHLSNQTVSNAEDLTIHKSGAYEQAIEHFISKNDIADLSPLLVKQHHFERIIFKPGIKTPTRWFYFKQLRAFWNKLLDWDIVTSNYMPDIKKDLPEKKSNARPKMLSEQELHILFSAFDDDLKRKRGRSDWSESFTQHWFKPLISVYAYCGLRKSEAAYNSRLDYSGLQAKNLEFYDGQLSIIYLPPTKGRKERSVPIPKPCRQKLRKYLLLRGQLQPNDYIFIYMGGRRKGYPVTGAQAYKQYKCYLKKANLPKTRTLHGMRHERVTTWLQNGYYATEAQYMAGHTSIKTTQGYTHLKGKNLYRKQQEMERD